MTKLTQIQRNRYKRHIMLSEIGESGQEKLLQAKVLVVGLGGLGSPVAYYLAASGVGTLGIADSDRVDITNLQRQILHSSDTIGILKTESARRTLKNLNPDVKIIKHNERLTTENARQLVSDYDIIVDACDNFETRYVMNDICYELDKPLVHGSIFQFEGRTTVFIPEQGPCYRCLYPERPPEDLIPGDNEIGLLGVLPGVIGTIQATETIKLILGIGTFLAKRMLIYDALNMDFQEIELKVSPECPLCKEKKDIS
ncbi:molybdopterin-synthase adenylyltransferase MoeB [Candidatus Poribacteria bacterium]|nr:molybdopterin-synthase adenylyltransferase MoeB [Candidatus Poribacteria bacterium]